MLKSENTDNVSFRVLIIVVNSEVLSLGNSDFLVRAHFTWNLIDGTARFSRRRVQKVVFLHTVGHDFLVFYVAILWS